MGIFDFIIEYTNKKGEEFVKFVLDIFTQLSGFLQAIVLLAAAFLVIIGAITVIKKSFKLILVLGIIFVVLFVIWTFV
ncbi:MAG: hypothetical protein PHG08_01285 [Bacilli bacterium]|jgi:hypothetical protein|nr:hypothetical protein [Bacilli bacterium]HHU24067.1 hypothetical protein [Acholeplasmataceae bacterium]